MLSRHAEHAVRRHLVTPLRPASERRMRAHLAQCQRCRRFYAAALLAERALVPHLSADGEPDYQLSSPRARARAATRLLDTVAPSQPERRPMAVWLIAPALVAATVLLVVFWPRPEAAPPLRLTVLGQDLQARGVQRERPQGGVDLRLVCVSTADGLPLSQSRRFEATELADGDPCGSEDVLFLAYTTLPPHLGHLFVLGIDGIGDQATLHRYYPRPGAARSVTVWPGDVDRLLGRGMVVGRRHVAGGSVVLVAIFSAQPLGADEIEGRARALLMRGAALEEKAWKNGLEPAEVLIRRFEALTP